LRCDKQQPPARADQFDGVQKLILSPVDERRTAGIKLLIGAAAQKLNGSVHLHHTERSHSHLNINGAGGKNGFAEGADSFAQ
jgi:carbon monoxide dehydrogenase subunit G